MSIGARPMGWALNRNQVIADQHEATLRAEDGMIITRALSFSS